MFQLNTYPEVMLSWTVIPANITYTEDPAVVTTVDGIATSTYISISVNVRNHFYSALALITIIMYGIRRVLFMLSLHGIFTDY